MNTERVWGGGMSVSTRQCVPCRRPCGDHPCLPPDCGSIKSFLRWPSRGHLKWTPSQTSQGLSISSFLCLRSLKGGRSEAAFLHLTVEPPIARLTYEGSLTVSMPTNIWGSQCRHLARTLGEIFMSGGRNEMRSRSSSHRAVCVPCAFVTMLRTATEWK